METPLTTTTTTTQQQQHKMFRLFKEIWNPIDLKKEFVFYEYENDDVAIKKVKQTFRRFNFNALFFFEFFSKS